MIRFALPLVSAFALAACDKGLPDFSGANDTRSAEGNVEGGSISDAMIPLDTVTSTAPPLKDAGEAGAKSEGETGADEADASADDDASGTGSDVAEPAPTPAAADQPN